MSGAAARVLDKDHSPKESAISASETESSTQTQSFDARRQREHLEDSIKSWAHEDAADDEARNIARAPKQFGRSSKAVKAALALAVALAFGYAPVQRLLATTSVEAVIDARIVTLRAPIDGEIAVAREGLDVGARLAPGETLLTVLNPDADQSQKNALRRAKSQTQATISALADKRIAIEARRGELLQQEARFRVGRVEQLQKRLADFNAQIAGAEAQHRLAAQMATRARALKKTGFVSEAGVDKAVSEEQATAQEVQSLVQRRDGARVELDAARQGAYIGDTYNDTPQSAQRALELGVELAEIQSRLAAARAELADIDLNLAEESKRVEARSVVPVAANVAGRVWETLVAPGEHVAKGQDLLRLLDCASAMVSASVAESAYQSLRIGQKATFRPRDGSRELHGFVVGLNGFAMGPGNAAIGFNALSRAPYHATLKFPDLAAEPDCRVGRGGLVTFDPDTVSAL